MAAVVKLNSSGMRALLKSAEVASFLKAKAEVAAAKARATAPVASGAYRASIRVEVVQHPSRVVARVVAGTDHALVVEANTGNLARSL